MSAIQIYNKQGQPIDNDEYVRLLGDKDYKKIALTKTKNGFRVSTVWLGLDHAFGGPGPLIFETMVFMGETFSDKDCERYATEADALTGHAAMVAKWEKKHTSWTLHLKAPFLRRSI